MGNEHRLGKRGAIGLRHHRQRHAAQWRKYRPLLVAQGEGNKPGARRGQLETELLRDPVAEIGRTQLGEGQSPCRDDERIALQYPMICA